LFSKTQTDVLEVISFFVTCYEQGLVDMLFGIRKMLSLVLYAEKTIKDAVTNAYKRLYLTPGGSRTNSSVQIAKQLIKLVKGLTVCERDALQELIGEFAASGELDATVTNLVENIRVERATSSTSSARARLARHDHTQNTRERSR
jgi:condensin complex subunit 1